MSRTANLAIPANTIGTVIGVDVGFGAGIHIDFSAALNPDKFIGQTHISEQIEIVSDSVRTWICHPLLVCDISS